MSYEVIEAEIVDESIYIGLDEYRVDINVSLHDTFHDIQTVEIFKPNGIKIESVFLTDDQNKYIEKQIEKIIRSYRKCTS